MYWPTLATRALETPSTLNNEDILRIVPSRKGNFFATLTWNGLGIWDVRPTVLQTVLSRSLDSVERWGENTDVFWATDGRGLIVLTSTSHLLIYKLVSTSQPAYDQPASSSFITPGGPGEGDVLVGWKLEPVGTAFVMGKVTSVLPQPRHLHITLQHPGSILTVPWPIPSALLASPGTQFPPNPLDGDGEDQAECEIWDLTEGKDWIGESKDQLYATRLSLHRTPGLPGLYIMQLSNGQVCALYHSSQTSQSALPPHQASPALQQESPRSKFVGSRLWPIDISSRDGSVGLANDMPAGAESNTSGCVKSTHTAINTRFGIVAVGTSEGSVDLVSVPTYPAAPRMAQTLDIKLETKSRLDPGPVTSLNWTSDGYALAVGYEHGWAIWSVSGRLNGCSLLNDEEGVNPTEAFAYGVDSCFWAPGNLELFILAKALPEADTRLYALPFVKSATSTQHSPDNTLYAFLQMDDRVLAYRGADQPDQSVINPESDVWQPIKIPNAYISTNWPIRYTSISSDGKLIAVAGRRGLTHYSAASGRWKLFADEREEKEFIVRGGLLWFHHVLIAAVEVDKTFQIRLYSRDNDLSMSTVLHSQILPTAVTVMSLLDNSLLVYTADNTLYHFLILPTVDSIRLHLCGSISFAGILEAPTRVRALSWLIPQAQKELGDPADDLIVATIIFLVDGKLVLLRPRRAANDEVRYDMQVLADRIEAYWTHLHGIGTLENSLWGYDGKGMRVWLDALTIEATKLDSTKDAYESVKESIYIPHEFYPLSILMDKGIIIGVDYETSSRSLPFTLFKLQTGAHLFLPQFLRYHLSSQDLMSALAFATNYSRIKYFAHSLEILLHSVLEDEVETGSNILPLVIEFLDHFPESLDVVVGCARKIEVERWGMLFKTVGKPRDLFERCLDKQLLRTAAGYLLVLQNLEELDDVKDTVRLLRLAMASKEYGLCKEVLRFLHSIDETGQALRQAISDVEILPEMSSSPAVDAPLADQIDKLNITRSDGAIDN
ncbi:RIC1-domain-containing protein [Kockovaella imperatae]|uniref:RIC1-domain-containing protein n=1 Tax=Kockovaella imperatae TaxID=4999 RepID=A0A1Y1UJS0_9TREE|nr:RIC1-domain-containing protein [Kockovaella imperatae]ORX38232.1 RIC1-domain-containing protein [Kockovaella imperatae]